MLNRTSPLRVEINPWTLDHTLTEVMQLRGAYVAAMGTVETILTELAIRASKHQAYAGIRARFPSRRPDRLKYLTSVCNSVGPLTPYRGLVLGIIHRFENGLVLRDIEAHGRMQVITGPGDDASIKLEDYSAAGEFIQFRQDQYTLKTMRLRVYRATRLSRSVDMLYGRLDELLPAITGEFQDTTPLA
ncbi:hypothetical protein HRV97_14405 [Sphingomonas sp. HHU CXW]|uniref:Uncharacterized protein n=1 Tax=Sphingomonas hominis TaxID=2741495 RepID=A0ABX2JPG6_9SPHN|nr:hypothetical protein [Sphingomonas hominis]NTS66347.1 hypothetical protein [Sphingomonas hominis]